jgi:hypothetical protein
MKRKQQQPPYKGSVELHMPDGTKRRIKLPTVEGYEVGQTSAVTGSYKDRPFTIRLVRVAGGWEIAS